MMHMVAEVPTLKLGGFSKIMLLTTGDVCPPNGLVLTLLALLAS
jgi:hypothetical protein